MENINLEFLQLLNKTNNLKLSHNLKVAKGKYKYPSTIKEIIKKIYL